MNPLNYFLLLGRCLSVNPSGADIAYVNELLNDKDFDSYRMVKYADNHLILPLLFNSFTRMRLIDLLPEDLREYLWKIYQLNSQRNKEIKKQINEIDKVLKAENVNPVFFKGSGNLVDELFIDPGERIMNDIDFLVKDEDFEKAANILHINGYNSQFHYENKFKKYIKHYPPLTKKGETATIEIHRLAVNQKRINSVDMSGLFGFSRQAENSALLVPSDEYKLILNFLHSQFENGGALYARIRLRSFYDLYFLSQRLDIEEAFSDYGIHKKNSGDYCDLYYKVRGLEPPVNKGGRKVSLYLFRFHLNLKYKLVNKISNFLIRFILSYIKKPVLMVINPYIRHTMFKKLGRGSWYRTHFSRLIRVI